MPPCQIVLRDLTEKGVNFGTWSRGSMNRISPIGEKKNSSSPKKNSGKLQLFDQTISLPEPKFYQRIYGDYNSL